MSEKDEVAAAILKAKAELDQALAELEKMSAFDPGVVAYSTHALNNYLAVTRCSVELLSLSLADHPDPNIRRWLEALGHATELMRYTVSQLMTYSVPKNAEFRFLKWDLPTLVGRACYFYQRIADRKNILIVYDSTMDAPPVWTDPIAVAAILDNLLSNALKYSYHGKHIWVQVRGEVTSAVCSVRDEGPGLSQEDHAKLFQRGVRLSPMPTGGEPSSGYGLAVAKDLIDKLGGQLWCDSQLGVGTSFSFRLPAYQEEGKKSNDYVR
jgi:signal transduction histidine kinase